MSSRISRIEGNIFTVKGIRLLKFKTYCQILHNFKPILQCQEQCPYGKWGNGCRNHCQCKNDGTCDPIDGSCSCKGNEIYCISLPISIFSI